MRRYRRTLGLTFLLAALSGTIAAATPGATEVTFRAAIYSIRDDGTGRRLISQPDPAVSNLVRSPGGGSIAFTREVDGLVVLFAAETSGANAVRLSPPEIMAALSAASFSPDGRTIAFGSYVSCGYRCVRPTLYVVGRDGTGLRVVAENADWPSWASDSRRLAYRGSVGTYGGAAGIYVTDIKTGEATLVARGRVDRPVWAPRGERIAYTWSPGYGLACFVNADGSRRRCTRGGSLTSLLWSRDGKRVAFRQATPRRLGIVDANTGRVRLLGYRGRWARPAAWSPDGRRLAYWFGSYGSFSGKVFVLNIAKPRRPRELFDERGAWLSDLRWRNGRITYVAIRREAP